MYHHREGNSANKSHETEKLQNRCVVDCCSCITVSQMQTLKGISLHVIPFAGNEMPEATGESNSGLTSCALNEQYEIQCSAYFAKEDFTVIFSSHSGKRARLATDEIGIVAIPKIKTYKYC